MSELLADASPVRLRFHLARASGKPWSARASLGWTMARGEGATPDEALRLAIADGLAGLSVALTEGAALPSTITIEVGDVVDHTTPRSLP